MLHTYVPVVRTIGELAGLPLRTRIATNHNKLLFLDEGYGSQFWFEEGELTPYSPIVDWLPAFILPPPVDPLWQVAEDTVREVLGDEAANEIYWSPNRRRSVCEVRVEPEED